MKYNKLKLKCDCHGNHHLEVERDEDNIYYFSVKGDCKHIVIQYKEEIEKLRKFLKK